MRLVQITHIRCGEYHASTFVLAPDDWDEDRIEEAAEAAQEAYLAALKVAAEDAGPGPPFSHSPPWDAYPDKTVAEVKALHAEQRAVRDAWNKRRYRTCAHFGAFLAAQGFKTLWDDDAGIEAVEIDWGHRHGTSIDYSETLVDGFPSPQKLHAAASRVDDPLLDFG